VAVTSNQEKLKGNNLYIVLVLVSLLIVGATAIIAKSLIGTISINTKVVTAKDTANKQLGADLQAAPQLVDSYEALGSQQQTLNDALPNDVDFPDLLVTLDNISNNSGVTLKAVSPDQSGTATTTLPSAPSTGSVNAPQPQTYGFSISVEGSFASLGRLLNAIETSARPMRVVGVQISGTGSDVTCSFDIDTYYQGAGQLPFSTESIK
jgi:Tfp pilus assembly protein PilO